MTAGGGIFGSQYKPDSPEARTLKGFSTDKFDYRDQQKNLIQLNNAVGYMSGYMRKMQKGIDDANQNFIQQIQSLISDIFVLVGGQGDTGFDFGDLKYVFQAWGALFGFGFNSDGTIALPVNLFGAAWHFFSNYLLPFGNFHDAMNMIIDAAIATMIDWFGDIPIVGQAVQQLAVFISNLRDLLLPAIDLLDGLMDILTGDPLGGLGQVLSGIFGQLGALLGFDATGPIAFINSIISSLFDIPNFIIQIINNVFSQGFSGLSSAVAFVNKITGGIFGWLSGWFNAVTGQTTNAGDVELQDAVDSAQALIEQQIANSLAILQLQNNSDGTANDGIASYDDFERVNNTDINQTAGANDWWDIRQDNALSNGYYAILDGHQAAFVNGTAGTSQTQYFRRKKAEDAHTKTLYQRVSLAVGTVAGDPPFLSGSAWIRLRCRMNDADTQEVFCHISTAKQAQFGYRNGSAEVMVGSVFDIGAITASTTFYLDAGEIGGLRQFNLYKNTSVVASWTDSTNLTAASTTDNLGWGWSAHAEGVAGGRKRPPAVAIISVADNVPAATRGNGFRAYRAATGSIGQSNGAKFANNTLDTVDRISNGMVWDATNQKLTVSKEGWYSWGIRYQSGSNQGGLDFWGTCLFWSDASNSTPVLVQEGQGFGHPQVFAGGAMQFANKYMGGEDPLIYLRPGESIYPGSHGGMGIVGDAAGARTWFAVSLVTPKE